MMKKVILFFVLTLVLASCSLDDDGPVYEQKLATVSEADLPESFVRGNVYTIDIVYLLPDACHIPLGVNASRGGESGEDRRKIYVAGVVSREKGVTACTEPNEDLEVESSFSIRIDETDPYTFYLWTGVDSQGKAVYTVVEVPVLLPGTTAS